MSECNCTVAGGAVRTGGHARQALRRALHRSTQLYETNNLDQKLLHCLVLAAKYIDQII